MVKEAFIKKIKDLNLGCLFRECKMLRVNTTHSLCPRRPGIVNTAAVWVSFTSLSQNPQEMAKNTKL